MIEKESFEKVFIQIMDREVFLTTGLIESDVKEWRKISSAWWKEKDLEIFQNLLTESLSNKGIDFETHIVLTKLQCTCIAMSDLLNSYDAYKLEPKDFETHVRKTQSDMDVLFVNEIDFVLEQMNSENEKFPEGLNIDKFMDYLEQTSLKMKLLESSDSYFEKVYELRSDIEEVFFRIYDSLFADQLSPEEEQNRLMWMYFLHENHCYLIALLLLREHGIEIEEKETGRTILQYKELITVHEEKVIALTNEEEGLGDFLNQTLAI